MRSGGVGGDGGMDVWKGRASGWLARAAGPFDERPASR